jgi:hypothetical protein
MDLNRKLAETSTDAKESSSTPLLDRIAEAQAQAQARYLPVMDIKTAVERVQAIREMKELLLKPSSDGQADGDYGVIPGTNKPTLFKPGAEKICAFFGYVPYYDLLAGGCEDWLGDQHAGEPLFYYHVRCILARGGVPVGQGTGSASSWESKYRYRTQNRQCPACRKETIIKGRAEYGGGWLCFVKKGGCGEKFADGDQAIEGQATGQIANENVFDLVNTVQKMADKRAYVAATLSATGASQWFTQDMEDAPPPQLQDTPRQPAQHPAPVQPAQRPKALAVGSVPVVGPIPARQKSAGLFGAESSDDDGLKAFMRQFTQGDLKSRLAMFKSGKDIIVEAVGRADLYYDILALFDTGDGPCEHANQLESLDAQQKAVRQIWIECARLAAER